MAGFNAPPRGWFWAPPDTGTRSNPDQLGSLKEISPNNLTPGNLARAVIEGMAQAFRVAADQIEAITDRPPEMLVGTGNGLRENGVLAEAVRAKFGLEASVTEHREEAAFGAALIAGVGSGVLRNLEVAAASLIRYA